MENALVLLLPTSSYSDHSSVFDIHAVVRVGQYISLEDFVDVTPGFYNTHAMHARNVRSAGNEREKIPQNKFQSKNIVI